MSRILILTAGYGEGHNAAARALADGVRSLGAEADVRDILLEAYGHKQETARRLYLQCIDRAPLLWAAIYRSMEFRPLAWATMRSLWPAEKRLREVIAESQPDAVVSVYPAYGHLLDRLYPKGAPFRETTIITDSISINSIWYTKGTGAYIVANDATAAVVKKRRPQARIEALGFPVRTVFADSRPTRKPPGNGEPMRVLFMVNHAKGGTAAIVRGLLEVPEVSLTVTVGRDDALGRELSELAARSGRELNVLGWVKNMPELLMSHHLLIGKAGGAATQESLAAHTPMLITQIVPGQEAGNAQLVIENECGAFTPDRTAILETIASLSADGFALWHRWASYAEKIGRPDSARNVARYILQS